MVRERQAVRLMAAFTARQFHDSNSSSRYAGWLAMRESTSASHACGSISFIFAMTIRLYLAAARMPPLNVLRACQNRVGQRGFHPSITANAALIASAGMPSARSST